ncbi:TetR/AcrR family transcriptional regulator [Henriciella sp. AS95]|uniref:TetR/AcrR family transcriptional regulator n=1 Tax=Henriciella sp. AS95 TaxID=3135782 RepID=UPI003178DBC6
MIKHKDQMANSNTSPTPRPRKPVQARAAETRSRILDVAYEVFAEKGYDTANTRDIAAAAGVTHTTIRYHFGSKDELWRETVRQMFKRAEQELSFQPDELNLPARERLKLFLRKYIYYCARNTNHARIMIAESVRGGERLDWMAENFIRPSHETINKVSSELPSGRLSGVSPVSLLYIVVAMCQLPFVLSKEVKSLYDVEMTSQDAIESHIQTVTALLFAE